MPTIRIGDNSNDDYNGYCKDTVLNENVPNYSFGSCDTIITCGSVGFKCIGLMKFDLSFLTNINSANQIISANLYLNFHPSSHPGGEKFEIYQMKKDWFDGTSCAEIEVAASCYNYQYYNTDEWDSLGALGSGDSEYLSQHSPSIPGYNNFDVTDSIKDQITTGNFYGFLFRTTTMTGDYNFYSIHPSEYIDGYRPYLNLSYYNAWNSAPLPGYLY